MTHAFPRAREQANRRAGHLLGFPPGYATGRAFKAFVDMPARAAVSSQVAAARRAGGARQINCGLLGAGNGYFGIADVGLVEEIGEYLALAIRVDQRFRRRADAAEALRAGKPPGAGR